MADDINIVVGAQNKASQILADVEKSTKQLTRGIDKMAEKTEESGQTMQIGFKSMAAGAAVIGSLVAAAKGISAAFSGMNASVEAFNTQEEAARGMIGAQLEYAAALQKSTNIGDEATLALMKQAQFMGVSEGQLNDVATAAFGLTEAFGGSTEDNLKKINQAINGNADAFIEYLPQLKDAATQTEKMAIINEAAAGGLRKLQEDTGSTKGIMERASGAFGDLSEKIGELVEPIYRVVYQGFAVFAETLQTALMPAIDMVSGGFDVMGPVIEKIMEVFRTAAVVVGVAIEAVVSVVGSMVGSITGGAGDVAGASDLMSSAIREAAEFTIGALTMMEVGWSNLGSVVQFATDYVLLQVERMRADMEHVFVTVIPAHIIWFAQNFTNILSDMGNAALTVMSNMGQKIGDVLSVVFEFIGSKFNWLSDNVLNILTNMGNGALTVISNMGQKISESLTVIFDFIASGMEGGVSGLMSNLGESMAGSLLEGFEAKTQQMPDDSRELMSGIGDAMAGGLLDGFEAKTRSLPEIAARGLTATEKALTADMAKIGGNLADEFGTKFNERIKGLDATLGAGAFDFGGLDQEGKGNNLKAAGQLSATESRLMTRGSSEDPMMQIATNTKEMSGAIKQVGKDVASELRGVLPKQGESTLQVEMVG